MIKISVIQFQPVFASPEMTQRKLETLLTRTSDSDIVVLPELANTGYNFKDRHQALELSEELSSSNFLGFLNQYAYQNKQNIISGINERDGDKLYNSAVLIGPEGIRGIYRKMHLFMNEKNIFVPGNSGLPVFEIDDFKIGILICFDYLFPEIWRILALKGADIIFHPSNLITPYGEKVVPLHAIVNRVFAVTANRIGTERGITFRGNSIIVNPSGEMIVKAGKDKEEILTAEIDPLQSRDKWITPGNHALDDRRPGEYGELLKA